MAKRQRIDSADAAVEVMRAAVAVDLAPPAHVELQDEDLPFYRSVIDEFARSEWTSHQLELAANLARFMADLESEERQLRIEGSVGVTPKGGRALNPRTLVIQSLAGRILSMRRSLSLHARAKAGEARDQAKRREIAKDIEGANPLKGDGDNLLGAPTTPH